MKFYPIDFATYSFSMYGKNKEEFGGTKDCEVNITNGNPSGFCEEIVIGFGKRDYVLSFEEAEKMVTIINHIMSECNRIKEN